MTLASCALALLALFAGCRSSKVPGEPAPTPARDAAATSVLPAETTQLVTAIVPDWTSTTAELRLWTRESGTWRPAGPAWQGVVGKTGAAWGIGLHGSGAPSGREGPVKREGDGKSPAGVFALRGSYGYAAAAPAGSSLPYAQVDASWKCVDDPASRHYNQILDTRIGAADWTSAEDMRRKDALYTWVVEVAHNPARTGGAGSCIFLHVWGGPRSVTVGCTAMAAGTLAQLMSVLAPSPAPMFVLLPRAEYEALAGAWALPGT